MSSVPGSDDHGPTREGLESERSRHLVVMTRAECIELLKASELGRVVLSTPSQTPLIRPVNFRFDEASQSVVFRTGLGSKFHALALSARALFEIDSIDPETRTAWSVIISGATEVVSRPAEIRRLDGLGLTLWAGGDRPHWIRIRARTITGRRIVLSSDDPKPLAADNLTGGEASAP